MTARYVWIVSQNLRVSTGIELKATSARPSHPKIPDEECLFDLANVIEQMKRELEEHLFRGRELPSYLSELKLIACPIGLSHLSTVWDGIHSVRLVQPRLGDTCVEIVRILGDPPKVDADGP